MESVQAAATSGAAAPGSPESDRGSQTNSRLRWRNATGPLTVTGLAVAGVAYLGLTNPHEGSLIPPCLLLTATGLDCPLCGGSRAIHDLVRGNVGEAADHNLLVVLLLPLLVVGLLGWLWYSLRPSRPQPTSAAQADQARTRSGVLARLLQPNSLIIVGVLILTAFTVLRNIPAFDYLDSGLQ